MPNIAVTFRQEITRIARREIRTETQALRRASARFRRDIAELKRQASTLKAEVARLEQRVAQDVAPLIAEAGPAGGRYSARSVLAQRKRLGLSAADYGKLIGVTGHTVYKWEHGTSRPRSAQISALASLRSLGKTEAITRLKHSRGKAQKNKRVARR